VCSTLCWIFSIWEALGWNYPNFGLIHTCQQGGEVWACFSLLNAFRGCSSGFEPFLGFVGHRSDRSRSPVWPVSVLALFRCWALVWPVRWSGLTGQSKAGVAALFHEVVCIHSSREVALVQGSLNVCRGSSLWFSSFSLVVFALCLSMFLTPLCRVVALA
jgi:hypothetical protein